MILLLVLVVLFAPVITSASAEPMRFQAVHTGGNCDRCEYVQATGEVTAQTPKVFEAFVASEQPPRHVRLDSPGGNLGGGVILGEMLRSGGYNTEVGSSEPDLSGRTFSRTEGVCASACAYAFLAGTTRSLEKGAKLGFHRFYSESALAGSAGKVIAGQALDDAQRSAAGLLLYVIKMGVDPAIAVLAASASPTEMRWVTQEEARRLRVDYDPWVYKPWRVEASKGGAIAVSESQDGLRSIVVSCSRSLGPNATLINLKPAPKDAAWFEQCRRGGPLDGDAHPIFGARVEQDRVRTTRRNDGALMLRFLLPDSNPPFSSSTFLNRSVGYAGSCSSDEYLGTLENFVAAARLALRNCVSE